MTQQHPDDRPDAYEPVQGGYSQNPYGAYPAPNAYQGGAAWQPQAAPNPQGQSHATTALVCGILSIVLGLGIILGPIAIWQAGKAQALGVDATAGRICGWIGLILGIIGTLIIVGYIILIIFAFSSGFAAGFLPV
ncbi:hypothetical protein [Nesterenkonia flava]|uniref:DUF4190 domain-containing protein n=1 Tax=Nesterenkonia flava TaxID=469799 RepID=A0ABU1FSC5_9MICC|nr:hypothetical protein [Nesterenkonia flava]MDR5711529.1 hypothetical protein [Nesterenkonia flava]